MIKIIDETLGKVDEKMLLIAIVGSMESIKNGGITIDEAEKSLFCPHIVNMLKIKKCNEKIIELIEKGCELEDIYSLIPENLNEIINEIEQEALRLMKTFEEYNKSLWI